MGFLDTLGRIASSVASSAANDFERKRESYSRGYEYGSRRASDMSTEELRASLRQAKDNGVSGMRDAGKVRAMADEYKNRKK